MESEEVTQEELLTTVQTLNEVRKTLEENEKNEDAKKTNQVAFVITTLFLD